MYYYAITGYAEVKELFTSTDENGEIVNTTVTTQAPTKMRISESQADEYVNNGTYTCYRVNDDGTEVRLSNDGGETLVGASPIVSMPSVAITDYSLTIPDLDGGNTHITNYSPTLSGYTLAGVIGYSVSGSSLLMPFRVYVSGGLLRIGIRNISSSTVTSKTMNVTLLWTLAPSQ